MVKNWKGQLLDYSQMLIDSSADTPYKTNSKKNKK